MATQTTYVLKMRRGLGFFFRFEWKDADGNTISPLGKNFVFAYREVCQLAPLFEITSGATPETDGSSFTLETPDISDPTTGRWLVNLTNAHTAGVTIDEGEWWLRYQVDDIPANDRRLGGGRLKVLNPS